MLTDVESCLWLSCKITQNAKLKRVALLTGASALLDDQRAREEALDVLDGHAGPERRGAATPRGAHVWFAVDIYIYIYIYIYMYWQANRAVHPSPFPVQAGGLGSSSGAEKATDSFPTREFAVFVRRASGRALIFQGSLLRICCFFS